MITVDYLHLCDYACVMQNGKPCLVGIFDRITAERFPAKHALLCLAVNFQGKAFEQASVEFAIVGPNGNPVAAFSATVAPPDTGQIFVHVNLIGLDFPEAGNYAVVVRADGREISTKRLTLAAGTPKPAASH